MRLKESVEDGIEMFALEGEIDLHYAPVLRSLFRSKLKASTPALLLDLSKVEYIDSTGLATIIEYYRDAARHAGVLCLIGLNRNLASIFEIVKLDKAIPMFGNVTEAITAIKQRALQAPPTSLFDRPAA
jgi:anti-sigma B factor antagonist